MTGNNNIGHNLFSSNTPEPLQGVLVGSCQNTFTNNVITRTKLSESAYDMWKAGQEANKKAGLVVTGTCNPGQGNHFTLNKLDGFERGISVASDYNLFTVNEVVSKKQDIGVTGNNNTIFRNNFYFNGTGSDDGKGNHWFSAGPVVKGGNYWSQWKAADTDADGFIDKPYALDGKGLPAVDALPLNTPVPLVESTVVLGFPGYDHLVMLLGISGVTGSFIIIRMRK